MTEDLVQRDQVIRKEADELLEAKGLRSLLKGYGTPHVTGSYALRLMTWRDLDIYLEQPDLSEESFFGLGSRIASCLAPIKMSFRNERINRTPNLPLGFYWGVYLGDERKGAWKRDRFPPDAHDILSLMDLREKSERWRQVVKEEDIWRLAIQQICDRAGIVYRSIRTDFHSNNAVFLLDHHYVVKLYAPDQQDSFRVEEGALRILATTPALPIPPLLAVGDLNGLLSCPYIVMGMVSGMPLDELRGIFGPGDLVNIATQLGTVMARFHGSYFSSQSQIGQAYGAWNTLYENRRHQFIENLGQTVSFPSCLKSELRAFVCSDENYRRRLMAFFLHSWEAAPKLATLLESENAPDIKDIGALLDWLWPRELETS